MTGVLTLIKIKKMEWHTVLNNLRSYFNTGITKSQSFRRDQLIKLKRAIQLHEEEIYQALYSDLKKSREECWVTENGLLISEINFALKNLSKWMRPKKVKTNLVNFPSSSKIISEPLGVVLIISPWNYPLQLLLKPLVGAIAAGNCAVVKASEMAPATSNLIKKIITSTFDPHYILFTEGDGALVVTQLINEYRFDHIFFTGSTHIGKAVYQMAAKQLVPVTLELGGKSPCIIDSDANLKVAAKRIALTKFSNAGQMCVAPDYLLVHESVKDQFIQLMIDTINEFFFDKAGAANHLGKIINQKKFDRIIDYMKEGTVIFGGKSDNTNLFIEPTLMDGIPLEGKIMKEEIFGPVLPIIPFSIKEEAIEIINKNKNPLAMYVFTESASNADQWIEDVPFGGGCINNASWHLTNHHLPFGGRGFSGIGQYQGKHTFDVFSHKKSILHTPTWFDPSIKYPPFHGKLSLFKKLIR